MRKILSLFILSMFVILLASCDGNSKSSGHWYVAKSANTDDVAMFNTWKERFESDYPQYEIIGESFTYSVEAFTNKANSKTLPTVFQTWFTEPQMIVSGGHAKDITDIVKNLVGMTK